MAEGDVNDPRELEKAIERSQRNGVKVEKRSDLPQDIESRINREDLMYKSMNVQEKILLNLESTNRNVKILTILAILPYALAALGGIVYILMNIA
jgi:hypothetical protein